MNKKINILFSSFPDFSGNPKALYEYIIQNYKEKINTFWVFYSSEIVNILKQKNKNINFVIFKSEEYYQLFNNIDIIFDTNGFLIDEKKSHQIYVNLWHGSSPKKKGFLLPPQNFAPQDVEYYNNMHLNLDYVVVPSQFSRLIFSSVFDINVQRVVSLGYCRDDYLFNCDGKKLLKNLFDIDISKYNKILCYLPTFRIGCNRTDSYNIWDYNLLDLQDYEEEELYKYLEENNYLLLIKKHPSEESIIQIPKSKNVIIIDDEILNKNFISIYEILNAVDLLIADYSSVYVEYLLLERPVLFLHKNLEEYKKKRGIILDNINFWSPGPQITTLQSFKKEIDCLLSDDNYYSQERKTFKTIMFDNNYKNVCKKTFEFFINSTDFTLNCTTFNSNERNIINNLKELSNKYNDLEVQKNKLKQINNNYEIEVTNLKQINNNLNLELEAIYNSRSWKIVNKFKKIIRRGK
ncbi:MAG: CDP-glycerol glycerophosphotransferase family protein [Clostridia bacterium]|nr:CDP-glycerol glycerophosphotransferase family protein [Clostridia bacterium]